MTHILLSCGPSYLPCFFNVCTFLKNSRFISFFLFLQLQLSADVEVVFARGTVTPEQQKKVPLTQTQDEKHAIDGDILTLPVITLLQNMKAVM